MKAITGLIVLMIILLSAMSFMFAVTINKVRTFNYFNVKSETRVDFNNSAYWSQVLMNEHGEYFRVVRSDSCYVIYKLK